MKHKIEIELKMPSYPNFLYYGACDLSYDVGHLADAGLEEFIEEWARGFREHVAERRESLRRREERRREEEGSDGE